MDTRSNNEIKTDVDKFYADKKIADDKLVEDVIDACKAGNMELAQKLAAPILDQGMILRIEKGIK